MTADTSNKSGSDHISSSAFQQLKYAFMPKTLDLMRMDSADQSLEREGNTYPQG